MDPHVKEQYDKVYYGIHRLTLEGQDITVDHVLFTWRWWLLIFLVIVPWMFWWKWRKKNSTSRLLFAGLLTAMIALILDFAGIAYGLWSYYAHIGFPMPPIFVWDCTMIPLTTMVFIQSKKIIHPLLKGIIFSFMISFIGEPFMT